MTRLQPGLRRTPEMRAPAGGNLFARIRTSRPVRMVLAAGALALLLIACAVAALLVEIRSREIKNARSSLLNLNALLAESTGRTLESVDLVLRDVLEQIPASAGEIARLKAEQGFRDTLKTRVSGLPQLDALSIVDAQGRLVSFSREFPIPEIDLSDREHFQDLKRLAVPEPYVSAPVQNRSTGAWTVYVARRILGADGRFLGAVYGGIDLGFFSRSYERLTLGRGTSISLWRLDGTLLVRHPPMAEIGRRFDSPAFRDLDPGSPPIVYDTEVSIGGGAPRIVARQVVHGFPVATAIARTRASVLQQSRQQVLALVVGGLLLGAAVVVVTGALARQFSAYEALARAERERAVAIEDLGALEDQLRQSQKLEVIGQLASGIAHDFNNLLTIVIGNLDRLIRRSGGEPELLRQAERARAGAERAAGLSRRLLAFSRRQPVEPRLLALNDVVRGLTDLLQQTLGRKAVLELSLAEDLPPVHADLSGLESALLNLVVNARDALAGGGSVTISTHRARPGSADPPGCVCVTVADPGDGMSPEVARRAFEPFFTTKEPGVGTGLGLVQVAGFARESGGTVAIDTAIGQGCRITLCLPPSPDQRRVDTESTS
jgi:signal transduction histidine kinase